MVNPWTIFQPDNKIYSIGNPGQTYFVIVLSAETDDPHFLAQFIDQPQVNICWGTDDEFTVVGIRVNADCFIAVKLRNSGADIHL